MGGLRDFSTKKRPYVFQSYHSHYDPDHHNFLPSGTVGIPPVVLGYLALAYNYLKRSRLRPPRQLIFGRLLEIQSFGRALCLRPFRILLKEG